MIRHIKRFFASLKQAPLPPAHVRKDAAGAAIEYYPMEHGNGWIFRRQEKYCGWFQYRGDPRKAKSYTEGKSRRAVIEGLEKINEAIGNCALYLNSWTPPEA